MAHDVKLKTVPTQFKNEKDVTQFVADSRRDAEPERRDQQAYIAKTRCYQLGLQWIGYQSGPAGGGYAKLVRWATDWVGRSGQIRATMIGRAASRSNERRFGMVHISRLHLATG